jgi:rare lipoprotein A
MRFSLASRLWAAAIALALSGCALYPRQGLPPPEHEVGVASWYGDDFHGRRTASGARFNQQGLTAAHPTLPLGSRVRVTNLDNNRSVVVVVNDRGPFVDGRVIDVSHGAARQLGMVEAGTAHVRLQPVEEGEVAAVSGEAVVKSRSRAAARRPTRVSSR